MRKHAWMIVLLVALILHWAGVLFPSKLQMERKREGELNDLENLVMAVQRASPELKQMLFWGGFADIAEEHNWPIGSCGQAFNAVSRASAEDKRVLMEAAFEDCKYMCPAGGNRDEVFEAATSIESGALADMQHQMRLLIAACDKVGDEPIFTGPWLDKREQMDFHGYLVSRALFDITRERLVEDVGSERAMQIWSHYQNLSQIIAAEMSLRLPPPDPDLQLPRSDAIRSPQIQSGFFPAITIRISQKAILVDDEKTVDLTGGFLVSSDLANQEMIVPLHARLLERAEPMEEALVAIGLIRARNTGGRAAGEGAKAKKEEGKVGKKDAKMKKAKGNKVEIRNHELDRQIAENAGVLGALRSKGQLEDVMSRSKAPPGFMRNPMRAEGPGSHLKLFVQCHREAPYQLVEKVLYTAGKLGFRDYQLAVYNDDEGRQAVIEAVSSAAEPAIGSWYTEELPLKLTVAISELGFTVTSNSAGLTPTKPAASGLPTIPKENGAHPFDKLSDLLMLVKDEYPDDENITIVPEAGIPWQTVIRVMDTARDKSDQDERRVLFSSVLLGDFGDKDEKAKRLDALRDGGQMDDFDSLTGGIGGLIGVKGTQIGSGGLGSHGSGGGDLGGIGAQGDGAIGAVGGDPIILGALDRSLIDEVIKPHMKAIRHCYQQEWTKMPSLGGKIVIKFVIAKDGSVSSASKKTSTMNNASVESCVVSRIKRMQFPQPKGGGIVIVSYPFLFSPG